MIAAPVEILDALRRRWWVLVLAACVCALAAYGYTKLPWVQSTWSSSVYIQASGRLDYGTELALTQELKPLAEEILQLSVMRQASQSLHVDMAPDVILRNTHAVPASDTGQITVTVDDSDPQRAQSLALAISQIYTDQHNAAEQPKLREERVMLDVLDRPNGATLVWPQTRLIVPAAAALGLIVAALVVAALAFLDDTLHSAREIQAYVSLPLLAVIPALPHSSRRAPPPGTPRLSAAARAPSTPDAARDSQPVTLTEHV